MIKHNLFKKEKAICIAIGLLIGFSASAKSSAIPVLNLSSVVGEPVTMQMEDFRDGGEGVAYHDLDAANIGNEYRLTEGVDIQGNGTGFNICYGEATEWLEYTINVPVSGVYSFDFSVASPGNDIKFNDYPQ